MRVCVWHGWLLVGSGSNVSTAKQVQAMRTAGHDVVLLCQEPHPERLEFVDAHGVVDERGVSELREHSATPAPGRVALLRPRIGRLLPVFVLDAYEGFHVKRFVDLDDAELDAYLNANAAALRAAVEWHRAETVIAGHIVPGPEVARRALGPGRYSVIAHGSDLEYAIDVQERFARMARTALEGATSVIGSSDDVLRRAVAVAPAIADRARRIPPGVDVDRFRPMPRAEALAAAAARLEAEPEAGVGRNRATDARARAALDARDGDSLDALALDYDQSTPDAEAASRLRRLAGYEGALVGYLGKLIVAKGVEHMLQAVAMTPHARGLVIGFGGAREWYAALVAALDAGDAEALAWLRAASSMRLEMGPRDVADARGVAERIDFTGMLDHRFAPYALAGLDVLVVPSTRSEAFGMVAAEGAACGALPLIARHSGLAEVAAALEGAIGRPGLLSFEPGEGAVRRSAIALARLLDLPRTERRELGRSLASYVAAEWTWARGVERLLAASTDRAA